MKDGRHVWAWCGFPTMGGTWTVFLTLRDALANHEIDLRWVGLGKHHEGPDPGNEEEHTRGEFLRVDEPLSAEGTRVFVEHLTANYDGVIVNIFAYVAQMNAMRFLPAEFPRVALVHSHTRATLRAIKALRYSVPMFVAPNPLVLVQAMEQSGDRRFAMYIGHGVAMPPDGVRADAPSPGAPIALCCIGRLKDDDRGVLSLPELGPALREKLPNGFHLTIVGDGPDRDQLAHEMFEKWPRDSFSFRGSIPRTEVAKFLATQHFLLSPARYEGFGLAVAEALSCGVVPVCRKILGSTDWMLGFGRYGILESFDEPESIATAIKAALDPPKWQKMSDDGRTWIRENFSVEQFGAQWARALADSRKPIRTPPEVPMTQWGVPAGLLPEPVAKYLPPSLKRLAKRLFGP